MPDLALDFAHALDPVAFVMRPDVTRAREPSGIVDSDLEGERYEGTDAGGGHQKTADWIGAHNA